MLWNAGAVAQVFTLTLQPNTIPAGTNGAAYSQLITAVGGNAPYTFALTSGSLPTGLILDPNGLLHGTPTTPSSGSFTFTATDVDGNTGFRPYNFSIGTAGGITISPGSPLPAGTQGVAYSQTLTASGGSGAGNVFSISAGSLPPGLSLSSGGVISGTPSAGGPYSFTASVIDNAGNTGTQAYTLNITVPIIVHPSSLPNGTTGTPYNQTVTATGGTGPYTFAVTAGTLPTGLSLAAGGGLTGTPTVAGAYSFTIQATDSGANTGSRAYNVTINTAPLTINPTSLPAGAVGTAYSQTIVASGGNGSYSYAVISGSLPTGLSLNGATGAITGTPSAGGTFNFTVQGTDTSPNTGTRAYSVNIGANSLTVTPVSLPNATQGVAYSQTVSASGGVGAPYAFTVSAGALPAGLSLNGATGAITGTPSGSGPATFTIRATDSFNNFGTRLYTVNTGTNVLTINPATLPAAVTGRPYSATVVAVGGTGPYVYSVSSGSLPPGLALNTSTGAISGTITGAGPFAFTISALDSLGNTGSRAYTLVNRPDPALDPEVIGLVNAQVAATRRFASAQIDNVSRHLESLHGQFSPCSVEFGVGLPPPTDANGRPYPGSSPYSPSPGVAARSYDAVPNSQVARRMMDAQECAANGGWASRIAGWVAGSVQFGSTMPDGTVASSRFTTAGLTAGIDWQVHNDLVVGAAVGYGNDHTTVGTFGTRTNATSVTGTLYASWKYFDPWFIDAAIGYGQLGFDNRRFVADDAVTVAGSRSGGYWFGAVSTGYEVKYDALRLMPYVRADFMSAQLQSYAELGASSELLTFNAMKFNSVGGTVGLRGAYDIPMNWGVLTPTARAEYRQALDGATQQSMYYSDVGASMTSTLAQASSTRGTLSTSLGLRARGSGGVSGEVEYGTSGGAGKVQAQTVRAGLKMTF